MDKIENSIQFNNSIFRNLNPEFWCKTISAHSKNFIPFTKYRLDAWHIAKSLMIILICAAIAETLIQFILLGITWNVFFNINYNRIFKAKKQNPNYEH